LEKLSAGRAEVRLALVEGGGHVVPGPASRFPAAVGRNVRTFQGVDSAMAFFAGQGPSGEVTSR